MVVGWHCLRFMLCLWFRLQFWIISEFTILYPVVISKQFCFELYSWYALVSWRICNLLQYKFYKFCISLIIKLFRIIIMQIFNMHQNKYSFNIFLFRRTWSVIIVLSIQTYWNRICRGNIFLRIHLKCNSTEKIISF